MTDADLNNETDVMGNVLFDDTYSKMSVLGMKWNIVEDYLFFSLWLNFSMKKRRMRSGPDILKDNIANQFPEKLTRREIIAQVNGIFDPMGLAIPVTVGAKILVRNLWSGEMKDLGWDDPIPMDERLKWLNFFTLLYDIEKVRFYRAMKPDNVLNENPFIVIFSDASEKAYGCCCYIRWQVSEGYYQSTLMTAKSKVAPAKS